MVQGEDFKTVHVCLWLQGRLHNIQVVAGSIVVQLFKKPAFRYEIYQASYYESTNDGQYSLQATNIAQEIQNIISFPLNNFFVKTPKNRKPSKFVRVWKAVLVT